MVCWVLERCRRWQGILGYELFLENFPSRFEVAAQIDFFQALAGQSMLGLLFDISNAEVAACQHAIGLNKTFGIARSRSWSVGAFGPVA